MTLVTELMLGNPTVIFVFAGDFAQFMAPCNYWHGTMIDRSRYMYPPCASVMVTLTKNRRCPRDLFNLYTKNCPNPEKLYAMMPWCGKYGRYNLTVSHQRRRRVVVLTNRRHKTDPGVVYLKSCLLYTSPSPRDKRQSRMPSSA